MRKFVIVNALGNCTAYDVSLKILKIFSACDSFELTPNNRLKHSSSGKCVVPVGIFNNASLTLHGNCNDINSIFQQTQTLQLKHTNSEMCISTQGDKSNRLDSLNVTKLTIDVRCDNRQEGAFKMVPGKIYLLRYHK